MSRDGKIRKVEIVRLSKGEGDESGVKMFMLGAHLAERKTGTATAYRTT
jgi:hypothetical protein